MAEMISVDVFNSADGTYGKVPYYRINRFCRPEVVCYAAVVVSESDLALYADACEKWISAGGHMPIAAAGPDAEPAAFAVEITLHEDKAPAAEATAVCPGELIWAGCPDAVTAAAL